MPRVLTEEHKQAMQEGRAAALAERRAGAVERVRTFRAWLKRDAQITVKRRAQAALGEPLTPRETMPELPSPSDFEAADAA
jgi:hypothetical protein